MRRRCFNMVYSDLTLIRMQVDALFVHDAHGQLLRINEPDPGQPAPRFFLGRTRMGNLWRTRSDLPPDLAAELERLAADEPVLDNPVDPPRYITEYTNLLNHHAPLVTTASGPAYYLPELDPPRSALTITPQNVGLLQTHFSWLLTTLAEYAPVAAVIVAGSAVAICFSSRLTPQAAEAGVYTQAEYRGHGYATDAVRGWAAGVRATGRQPLYSTAWSNTASQAVARKLGAVQYGADFSLT